MQNKEQLLKEKCLETGNWNELYAFALSSERNCEKKDLRSVPKYIFFSLKEHHVRNFDTVCILMGTAQEGEAHLYLCSLLP